MEPETAHLRQHVVDGDLSQFFHRLGRVRHLVEHGAFLENDALVLIIAPSRGVVVRTVLHVFEF